MSLIDIFFISANVALPSIAYKVSMSIKLFILSNDYFENTFHQGTSEVSLDGTSTLKTFNIK